MSDSSTTAGLFLYPASAAVTAGTVNATSSASAAAVTTAAVDDLAVNAIVAALIAAAAIFAAASPAAYIAVASVAGNAVDTSSVCTGNTACTPHSTAVNALVTDVISSFTAAAGAAITGCKSQVLGLLLIYVTLGTSFLETIGEIENLT